LRPQAQRKKLGKKEMPLLRALPEPARFFEKKRGQKTIDGGSKSPSMERDAPSAGFF